MTSQDCAGAAGVRAPRRAGGPKARPRPGRRGREEHPAGRPGKGPRRVQNHPAAPRPKAGGAGGRRGPAAPQCAREARPARTPPPPRRRRPITGEGHTRALRSHLSEESVRVTEESRRGALTRPIPPHSPPPPTPPKSPRARKSERGGGGGGCGTRPPVVLGRG